MHHEDYHAGRYERYVVAEGPVRLERTPPHDGTDPFLTAILEPESLIAVVYD